MSGSGSQAISLQFPYLPGPAPQSALLFFQVTNSDGTAPSLIVDPTSVSTADTVTLTQPVANTGFNASYPANQYPYVGAITATNVAGTVQVDAQADGVTSQIYIVTVTQAPPEAVTGTVVLLPIGSTLPIT